MLWSQKDPQRWYNFGIESPRDSSWKTSYLERFGATQRFASFFFSRGFFLELFQMPHNRTFGGECFESWQWSLVKTCFIPRNLLNPFQPSRLALADFFWMSLHEVSNNMRKTSYPWQPHPTWQADDEIPVRALLLAMPFLTKHSSRNLKALKNPSGFMQHNMLAFVCLFCSTWWILTLGSTLVLTLDPALQLPFLSM